MKPWISVDEVVAEMSKEEAAHAVRAKLWADYLVPPHGIRLDQRRIGDRFLELLAAQNRPGVRLRTRPRVTLHPDGGYTIVDEIHEWREAGYTDGGGTVWVAPLRRQRAQGGRSAAEEYREVMRAVVGQLADEAGVPRKFLSDH